MGPRTLERALGVACSLALVAGVALGGAGGAAQGPQVTQADVLVVVASNAQTGIDPRLADVPALRRPPFDSFRSMSLHSSPRVDLRRGQPSEVALPNGRRIRIVLREITTEGRYRLQVSINRPGQQDYLPALDVVASPGDPFFIAGQTFENGTLVIGIRLARASNR
jgi:hypothetical protein